MKKPTLILSLVSLVLTVIPAQAAMLNDVEIVTLPEFRVSTSRYTEAEKSFRQGLDDLKARARPATYIVTELPSLGTVAAKSDASKANAVATKSSPRRAARS